MLHGRSLIRLIIRAYYRKIVNHINIYPEPHITGHELNRKLTHYCHIPQEFEVKRVLTNYSKNMNFFKKTVENIHRMVHGGRGGS